MLALTLSSMKQAMIDNETGFGLEKKFGCVKISTFKTTPCTVSFWRIFLSSVDELHI
jgi:hypothetical protein